MYTHTHAQTHTLHLKSASDGIGVLVSNDDESENASLELPNPLPHQTCSASKDLDMVATDSSTASLLDQPNQGILNSLFSDLLPDFPSAPNSSPLLHQTTSFTTQDICHQMEQYGESNENSIRGMDNLPSDSNLESGLSNDHDMWLNPVSEYQWDLFERYNGNPGYLSCANTPLPLEKAEFDYLSHPIESKMLGITTDDSDQLTKDSFAIN